MGMANTEDLVLSLLNDVLRDLSARGAATTVPAIQPVPEPLLSRPRIRLLRRLGILALGGLLGGLVVFGKQLVEPSTPRLGTPISRARISGPTHDDNESMRTPPTRFTSQVAALTQPRPLVSSLSSNSLPRVEAKAEARPEIRPLAAPARPPPPAVSNARAVPLAHAPPRAHLRLQTSPPEALVRPSHSPLEQLERRVLILARHGDYAMAWKQIATAPPQRLVLHPRYLRLAASVATLSGHWKRAIRYYTLLCHLEPDSASDWAGLGLGFAGAGRTGPARVAIQHALALGIHDPELRRYLRHELVALSRSDLSP